MVNDGPTGAELKSKRNRAPLNMLMAVPASRGEPVFTVPEAEDLQFAIELSGGIDGVVDRSSYLFVTAHKKGHRAFVVPKDDPSTLYEVLATNGKLDVDHHRFQLELGKGHNLSLNSEGGRVSGSLDGYRVRVIERYQERHMLVTEKHLESASLNDGPVSDTHFAKGDSWTFLEKNNKTGRILKFTQSGTGGVGRLEVIQGDPLNDDAWESQGKAKWLKTERDWLFNGETERPPISVAEGVTLPDSMKQEAIYEERFRTGLGRAGAGGIAGAGDMYDREINSLGNLLQPSDRLMLRQQEVDAAVKLNAQESRNQAFRRNLLQP